MKWPGPNEIIFSVKAFTAAMTAFAIACWLDLPRPYWSVFTVYIVMQPISGAVRSKSWYRFIGTVTGAAISLFLMGLLADLPALLFLVMGAVILACLFFSLIDLMPNGYAFALVGITTLVVGFTSLLAPETAFDTALARTEEILLGVLTSVVVDSVLFPRPAGRLLDQQVRAWFAKAADQTRAAVDPSYNAATPLSGLTQLAVDAAALDALSAHIAYDTVPVRPDSRVVRMLHARMLRLISLIFASGAWLETLRTEMPTPQTDTALAELRSWAQRLPEPEPGRDPMFRSVLGAFGSVQPERSARAGVLASIGSLLASLIETWEDCILLRNTIEQAAPLPDTLQRATRSESLSLPYADKLRAALILLPCTLSYLAIFAYWSATGWDQGLTASLQALTVGLLAGLSITPVRQTHFLFVFLILGSINAIIYQFVVLPAISDLPLLVFSLGVFLLPVGAFVPITPGTALLAILLTLLQLGLQPVYQAQFGQISNSTLAGLTGFALSSAFAWLIGVPNPSWSVRHLRRVGWARLAAIADGSSRPNRAQYTRRALDRFAAIAAQVPVLGPQDERPNTGELLGEIRVGVNMLLLREQLETLPRAVAMPVEALLAELAKQFRALSRGGTLDPVPLRQQTDVALRAAAQAMPGLSTEQAWMSLADTQRWLYPATPGQALPEAVDAR
jgi:uncharacterized membrane protein YccC